jgi:4'-phosphopantetheinyl transferase
MGRGLGVGVGSGGPRLISLPCPPPFSLCSVSLAAAPVDAQLATLSATERERAARLVFERDRRRYHAAHVALRQLLAARTGVPAVELTFNVGPFGKPSLQSAPRCAFNLSHSDDVAWVAMADSGEIGVDVELLRPMPDATDLARHNFSAEECHELAAARPEDRALAFLLGWTRKEACLKAIGSGLSIAPNIFTAGLTMGPRSVDIATPEGTATVWVQSFRQGTDIVGSLARIESMCR